MKIKRIIQQTSLVAAFCALTATVIAQNGQNDMAINGARNAPSVAVTAPVKPGAAVYLNPVDGLSVEDAVRYALAHHQGLLADRKLIDEAQGRLKQAALRANPMLDVSHTSDLGDIA